MEVTVVDIIRNNSEDHSVKDERQHSMNNEDKALLGKVYIRKHGSSIDKKKGKISWDSSKASKKSVGLIAVTSARSIYEKVLITPNSIFKRNWDIIMELVLAYNVVTTLYFLAYAMPGTVMLSVDLACWIIFLIDIPVTFYSEQTSNHGKPIRKFKKISLLYLKSWFFLDVFAIIPLGFSGNPRIEYYFRMVRLLKLPGVLNITDGTGLSFLLTYFNFGKKDKKGKIIYSIKAKIIASFIQLLIILIFIIYFLGCLWFWFQKTVNNYKHSNSTSNEDELNFGSAYELNHLSSEHVALSSSYFMLTTIATVGYGDFLPTNVYEMAFISLVMLFGVGLFAVIMGNFNSAIAYYVEANSTGDYLGELNNWIDSVEKAHKKLKAPFRSEIIAYFEYYFNNDRLKNLAKNYWEAESVDDLISISQDYLKDLPEDTYFNLLSHLFEDFLSSFRVYFTESEFKFSIIPHLQPRGFQKDKYVLKNGQVVDEILFVLKGEVCAGIEIHKAFQSLLMFSEGKTVLGDYNAIFKKPNQFDYLAVTFLSCFSVNSETFVKILKTWYKSDKDHITGMASTREINLKRLLFDHLSLAGLNKSEKDEITNRYSSKLKKGITKSQGYTEDLIDLTLAQTVKSNQDLTHRSSSIMRNLNIIESTRSSSINNLK